MRDQDKGFIFGLIGMAIFAGTLPVTKLATIAPGFDGLHPLFIAFGRAVLAGLLAGLYLLASRARLPTRDEALRLALQGLGIVLGWPILLGLAVQYVDAIHAAVITGALPLATAGLSALIYRQKAGWRFWAVSGLGFALVLAFAILSGGAGIGYADLLLLAAVIVSSAGYVIGARLSATMRPEQVISWTLVFYLPIVLPVSLFYMPQGPVAPQAWLGFGYAGVFSMWLGFFAWYRGLALGGTMRVSQVQLLQPFLSMLIAVPLLGEKITLMAGGFCLAIIATVALSRRVK